MALEMKELMEQFPQPGTVEWIGIRSDRGAEIEPVSSAEISIETGLIGDHYAGGPGSKRQLTLIQREHLEVVASILRRDSVSPSLVRRNIVVSGLNLLALKNREFQIGEAILRATGNCQPCSRMEQNLGPGGYNALRGHGGITATVVRSGNIRIGDTITMMNKL